MSDPEKNAFLSALSALPEATRREILGAEAPKDQGQVAYEAWCYAYAHKAPPGGFTPWRGLEPDMKQALAEQEAACRELERAAVVAWLVRTDRLALAAAVRAGSHLGGGDE